MADPPSLVKFIKDAAAQRIHRDDVEGLVDQLPISLMLWIEDEDKDKDERPSAGWPAR